jgi:hypothetical protein
MGKTTWNVLASVAIDNPRERGYTLVMGETKADKLTIHITGETSPELMGAGELAEFLQALEQSILSIVQRDSPEAAVKDKLALVAIGAGSVNLAFSLPPSYSPSVALLGSRMATGDISDLPDRSRKAVLSLSRWCRSRALTVDMQVGASKIASITPDLELRFETAPHIRGTAELYGKMHSVMGGDRPSFKLRLPAGELLACACGEGLARQAGKYLYRKVKAEGYAKNNVATGEICSFEATALELAEHKVSVAFEAIRNEYGSVFDSLDVGQFMKQVRGD